MNPSALRGTIAQVLGFAVWASDLTGHSAVGAILKDPNLATEATTFIGLAFTLWGVGEHLYAAFTAKAAVKANAFINSLPPKTLTEN